MGRYELSDFEWIGIEPRLPDKPCGVPRVDDRRVLNDILGMLRKGAPLGAPATVYNRFNRGREASVWNRQMDAITKAQDGDVPMIHTSVVRVH